MLRYFSINAVVVVLVAVVMTAGCAKQDVVKKDEGIVPVVDVKKIESATKSNETKSDTTLSKQAVAPPVAQSAPAPVSAQQPQKTSSDEVMPSTLEKIYFDFDSSSLSESSRSLLVKNATVLAKEAAAKIRIEGNCDERGSAEYNLALGERRAKAAHQYLVTMGIKPDRLSIISYGKEKPAVQGSDEAAWAKNRRDEFVVVTK